MAEEATLPLYEYLCPKCGRFELIRKFSDDPLKKCPTCGSAVQKLLSAPAIQFKGTGWYITDYARKDGKSGTGASGEVKADKKGEGGSSDSKSADSAAAAKTDTSSSKPAKGKKSS